MTYPTGRLARDAVLAAALVLAFQAARAESVVYRVAVEGVDGRLAEDMEAASRLITAEADPPQSLAGLRQRAEGDRDVFDTILRSEGYYGAMIDLDVDAGRAPARVSVRVDRGERYSVADCRIEYDGPYGPPADAPRDCAAIGLAPGAPARAVSVLAAHDRLLRALLESGRPEPRVERRPVVDHASHTMRLLFRVDPGREAVLGRVVVTGNQRTDSDFLAELKTWNDGDRYDARVMDAYRRRLADMNLFDSLDLSFGTPGAPDAVGVGVHERAPRSFGGGLRYATNEGAGAKLFWEHRNLWGGAERGRIDLEMAEIKQSLELGLAFPHTPYPEATIDVGARAAREDSDAYRKSGATLSAGISAPLSERWKGKASVALDAAEIDDDPKSLLSVVASLPVEAFYDGTDDLLDPTGGERLALKAAPVVGASGGARLFVVAGAEGSAYRALDSRANAVVAARLKLGAIAGGTIDSIPPDRRFYSGGGGSVRGFGYQRIGPRDAMGDPEGGRSLAEASLELRLKLTREFGMVAFAEAGAVGRDFDLLDEDPRAGAGVGLRYYTDFGPLRADVAVPLNKGPGDEDFQIYLSIGQAF